MNGVCKQTATRMVSSSPSPHGLIHQLASMEPPCNTRVPLQWARESLPHKPDKRHVDRARKQEMKWGWVFFRKKVDLSSTQGALCTVSVFFILHFTYSGGGVRTHPTHPLPTGLCCTPCCCSCRTAVPGDLRYRSISPAGRAHSSKPAAAACGSRMGRTDKTETDGHPTDT